VVDLLFTITFIFNEKAKQPAVRDMLRHFHGVYSHRTWFSTNQRARIRSIIVKYAVQHESKNQYVYFGCFGRAPRYITIRYTTTSIKFKHVVDKLEQS